MTWIEIFPVLDCFFTECVKYGHKHIVHKEHRGENILTRYHEAAAVLHFHTVTIHFRNTGSTQALHHQRPVKTLFPFGKIQQMCCHCVTALHHFLLLRRVEGKKAPSPSLAGEPHGLSSPQLMSSHDSSLSHKREPISQTGQKTIDACFSLSLKSYSLIY